MKTFNELMEFSLFQRNILQGQDLYYCDYKCYGGYLPFSSTINEHRGLVECKMEKNENYSTHCQFSCFTASSNP
jgi:hypothetical protein